MAVSSTNKVEMVETIKLKFKSWIIRKVFTNINIKSIEFDFLMLVHNHSHLRKM